MLEVGRRHVDMPHLRKDRELPTVVDVRQPLVVPHRVSHHRLGARPHVVQDVIQMARVLPTLLHRQHIEPLRDRRDQLQVGPAALLDPQARDVPRADEQAPHAPGGDPPLSLVRVQPPAQTASARSNSNRRLGRMVRAFIPAPPRPRLHGTLVVPFRTRISCIRPSTGRFAPG